MRWYKRSELGCEPLRVVVGTSDQSYPVTGQIYSSARGTFFGQVVQGPPDYSTYIIRFTGVPFDNGYTLTVSDCEGYGFTVTGIRVVGP